MKLKSRMTVGEMSEHLTEHTGKFANRVSVGRYAKKLGYAVYKPMINGRICQFYVNPSIKDDGEAETLRTNERENGHEREEVLAKGLCERIGIDGSNIAHQPAGGEKVKEEAAMPDHTAAVKLVISKLTDEKVGDRKSVV